MNYFTVSNHVDADLHNRMLNRSCSFSTPSSGKKIHQLLSSITFKVVQTDKLLFIAVQHAHGDNFAVRIGYTDISNFFYPFVISVEKVPSLLNGAHIT